MSFSDVPGLTVPGEPTDGIPQPGANNGVSDPQIDSMMNSLGLASEPFSWERISLGLEEPLPCQEIIDELYGVFASFFARLELTILGTKYTSRKSSHLHQ